MNDSTWVLVKYVGDTNYGINHHGELRRIHLLDWLRYVERGKAHLYQELTRGTYDEVRALVQINRS